MKGLSQMKITIDGYEANVGNRVGIGRFAYELMQALYRAKTKHDFVTFIPNAKNADLPPARKGWEYRIVPNKGLWTFFALPNALKREHCDVVFSPTHYIPLVSRFPRVCAIMDLSYLYFPSFFTPKDLLQLRLGTYYAVKKSKKIITISTFSKEQIVQYYHVDPKSITVAYPGYDHAIFKRSITPHVIRATQQRYNSGNNYILFTGTLQPRKNIVRLLEAFAQVKNRTLKLLIIGKKGWLYEEIFEKIKELHLADAAVWTDFVPDHDVAALMRGAKCLVLPSLYEGFGIPVIEAMACGTPVVVSNVSSLPEIAKDAGILIDPYNSTSIANGINRVLAYTPSQKDTMVQKGYKHLQQFSWDVCAQKVLDTLEKVV